MTQAIEQKRVDTELLRRVGSDAAARLGQLLGGVAEARGASELCEALVATGLGPRAIELSVLARGDDDVLSVLGTAGTFRMRRRRVRLDARSALAEAARTLSLVAVRDDDAHAARYGDMAERDRVLIAVPLLREGALSGVLGLRLSGPNELSAGEQSLLELLAAVTAFALPRFDAEAAERTRSSELEAVNHRTHALARISRELAEAGLVEQAILERAARGISEVFGDGCVIRMVEGAQLRTIALHHPNPSECGALEELVDAAADDPARTALTRGRAMLLTRVHRRVPGEVPLRKSTAIQSLMCAPIAPSAIACGVVLVTRERGSAHSEDDRLALEDVSYRVGLALGAARAYAAEQEARERAERAARGRDRVLSTVSHDLRAPLATVHLAAALLIDMGHDHEAFSDIVHRISRATTRMRRLVEDLLDLGQLESGVLNVRRRRVALCRVMEETADELGERARSAGKRLDCVSPPALEVLGDIERLQQVLVNLVVNAIDHTPPGTSIRIGAQQDHDRALVWVEDDGPGLDPALAEHLFEPHARGRSTTVQGAGLGLWIAKGLVEAHGGELRVVSGPGVGARFELSLPLAF